MARGETPAHWETAAAGLAIGLCAHAAPYVAAALIAALFLHLVRAGRIDLDARAPLVPLLGVAAAAITLGAAGAVGAALLWRLSVELDARTRIRAAAFTAPLAALAWRLGAPDLLAIGLLCIAAVAWIDWLVRRLADWRLDAPDRHDGFLAAQAAVLAPLLVFPDPGASLAAFAAMALARQMRWPASEGAARLQPRTA